VALESPRDTKKEVRRGGTAEGDRAERGAEAQQAYTELQVAPLKCGGWTLTAIVVVVVEVVAEQEALTENGVVVAVAKVEEGKGEVQQARVSGMTALVVVVVEVVAEQEALAENGVVVAVAKVEEGKGEVQQASVLGASTGRRPTDGTGHSTMTA
jgi:hypothetical protein